MDTGDDAMLLTLSLRCGRPQIAALWRLECLPTPQEQSLLNRPTEQEGKGLWRATAGALVTRLSVTRRLAGCKSRRLRSGRADVSIDLHKGPSVLDSGRGAEVG